MVDGLVAQSGGTMRIASQPGRGTTVELRLPVVDKNSDELPGGWIGSAEPIRVSASRSCRVLIVDDDPAVAAGTAAMLEDLGHVAIESGSAERALELLHADPEIEIVITDYAMPGMTGTELAAHVRRTWPDLPVAIATGFAEIPTGGGLDWPRLSKPYRQRDLSLLLASLIGERPRRRHRPVPVRAAG
jgi:CheY-like chemotaxis protein